MRLLYILGFFLLASSNTTAVSRAYAQSYENILHVSDIHYDSKYMAGTPNICYFGTKIGTGCCRKGYIGKGDYHAASKWGELECDTPLITVNATFNWIHHNIPNISFIIYTGDSVDHHDIGQTVKHNLNEIGDIYTLFDENFPGTPVFSSVGNHDTYPIDQTTPEIYSYMLNRLFKYWGKWLPDTTNITKDHGYYSHSVNNKLQIIGFNSIFYEDENRFHIESNDKDVKSGYQMQWLENQLSYAQQHYKKVILVNHIPVFGGGATSYYNSRLGDILHRYRNTLLIHLNGHEHSDHFYIYKMNETYSSYATIPNSILPSHNYPGFRVMQYDNATNTMVNYHQYVCNLTEITLTNNYTCELLYNFRDFYGVPDMSLNSFITIYENFSKNMTLLNKYLEFKNYGQPIPEVCNTSACVKEKLTGIMYELYN